MAVKTKYQVKATAPSRTPAVPVPMEMERRRPVRLKRVDSTLIPLLRGTPDLDVTLPTFDLEEGRRGDLAPPLGIMIGLVVSAVIWAAIIAVVAFVLS